MKVRYYYLNKSYILPRISHFSNLGNTVYGIPKGVSMCIKCYIRISNRLRIILRTHTPKMHSKFQYNFKDFLSTGFLCTKFDQWQTTQVYYPTQMNAIQHSYNKGQIIDNYCYSCHVFQSNYIWQWSYVQKKDNLQVRLHDLGLNSLTYFVASY